MPLKKYRSLRSFDKTPEPKPISKKRSSKMPLRFCVQRHKARRLHYDLRLELDGVLLSWAVPKGPSMDPKEKRLAVHVEDHPLDYITFAGEIPAGNYGAGTVTIFDEGEYEADPAAMRAGMKKGHISFVLHGKKLKGGFSLIKIASDDKSWLLVKASDDYAKKPRATRAKRMPMWFSPMLAQTVDAPFDDPAWLFEIKWDGYRALSFVNHGSVSLFSRNHKLLNKDYPAIETALSKLDFRAILDGEIVVLDNHGVAKFELLQQCKKNPDCNVHYFVFDLLYLDGEDLRSLPLTERKQRLQDLIQGKYERIHYSDHVEHNGIALFKKAAAQSVEGLIAKRMSSLYVSRRSSDWLKIKAHKRQEFVVGGFTKPRSSRGYFGSLLLGVYQGQKLLFVGHVGTGFSQRTLKEIHALMKPLIEKSCPFSDEPTVNEAPTWITPKLVADVSFSEWTKAGLLRQPVFHGLRNDKKPSDVVREISDVVVDEHVPVSNREKILWPKEGLSKGDMIDYYEAVAQAIIPHLTDRPLMLRRFPDGIEAEGFYQKNIEKPPVWLKTAVIEHEVRKIIKEDQYPIVTSKKSLLYVANLAAIEIHPMLARAGDLSRPDLLAIDLDPEDMPMSAVVDVALSAHEFFDQIQVPNFCKTSGGRGLHVYIPLDGTVTYEQSLRLAELFAHALEARLPKLISLERLPKKRQKKVYVDYLQNAKGKSMIAPYSLRARALAPVSTPLLWHEVKSDLDPMAFNIKTVPKRVKKLGDVFSEVLANGISLEFVLNTLEQYW